MLIWEGDGYPGRERKRKDFLHYNGMKIGLHNGGMDRAMDDELNEPDLT